MPQGHSSVPVPSPPRPAPSAASSPPKPPPPTKPFVLRPPHDQASLWTGWCCCLKLPGSLPWTATRFFEVILPVLLIVASLAAALVAVPIANAHDSSNNVSRTDTRSQWSTTVSWVIGVLCIAWTLAFALSAYTYVMVPARGRLTYDRPKFYIAATVPRTASGVHALWLFALSPLIHAALMFSLGGDTLPDRSIARQVALAFLWQTLPNESSDATCAGDLTSYWITGLLVFIVIIAAVATSVQHSLARPSVPSSKDSCAMRLAWWRAPALGAFAFVCAVPFAVRLLRVTPCTAVTATSSAGQVLAASGVCASIECGSNTHVAYITTSVVWLFLAVPMLLYLVQRLKVLNAEEGFATTDQNCVKVDPAVCGCELLLTAVLIVVSAMNSGGGPAVCCIFLFSLGASGISFSSIPSSSFVLSVIIRWGRVVDMMSALAVTVITIVRTIQWSSDPSTRDPVAMTDADVAVLAIWAGSCLLTTVVFARRWATASRSGCCGPVLEPGSSTVFDMASLRDIALM